MSADSAPEVEATVEIMFADYEAQLTARVRAAISGGDPAVQRLASTAWRLGWNAGYLDADTPRPVTPNPFPAPVSVSGCSCVIERPGTARECRILDRSCPVHGTAAVNARMQAMS